MKFCKDCKHFVDKTPAKQAPRIPYDYYFCDLESGRNVVDGRMNYAHLERITGKCGQEGLLWESRGG